MRLILVVEYVKKALDFFEKLEGVVQLKVLHDAQKKSLLEIESRNEEKKFMGMCKTYNKAARDAISRKYTLATIIKGGQFKSLPFPRMRMMFRDDLVGEELYEKDRIEDLKKEKKNVFLWDNFVVFMKKFPNGKAERDELVIIHTPSAEIPGEPSMFENLVMGEPCSESDQVIKGWLGFESQEGIFGTILIGFDGVKQ
jgi:hypothetical protein